MHDGVSELIGFMLIRFFKAGKRQEITTMTRAGVEGRPEAKVRKVSKSCLRCFILSQLQNLLLFRPK